MTGYFENHVIECYYLHLHKDCLSYIYLLKYICHGMLKESFIGSKAL